MEWWKTYRLKKFWRKWLADLPLANTQDTIRHLINRLEEEPIQSYPINCQLIFLGLITPLLNTLFESSLQRLQNTLSHQGQENADIETGLIDLLLRLNIIYQALLGNLSHQSSLTLQQQFIAYHALKILMMLLVLSCLTYTPFPPLLWQSIYTCYSLGEKWQILTIARSAQASKEMPLSVLSLFKMICLLATAHTNELCPSDIIKLSHSLSAWQRYTELLPYQLDCQGIVIQKNLIRPPHIGLNSDLNTPLPEGAYLLTTTTLLEHLKQAIHQHGEDNIPFFSSSLSKPALQKIYRAWSSFCERQSTRISSHRPVYLYPGPPTIFQAKAQERHDIHPLQAMMLNLSHLGCCLELKMPTPPIFVSQIVLLTLGPPSSLESRIRPNQTLADSPSQLNLSKTDLNSKAETPEDNIQNCPSQEWLGSVQWLTQENDGKQRLGLIYLGSALKIARLHYHEGYEKRSYSTLIFSSVPLDDADTTVNTLIILPLTFPQTHDKLWLQTTDSYAQIKLFSPVYSTRQYQIYRYTIEQYGLSQ